MSTPRRSWIFDEPDSMRLTEARIEFLDRFLPKLVGGAKLNTALDVGCGVGRFTKYLSSIGLDATGIDARAENVAEGQWRYPQLTFHLEDVESESITRLGKFDVVLCFGLLYHLENPFAAVRNLAALTSEILLVESVVSPNRLPAAVLVDEGDHEDEALRRVAWVPSEAALVKMLHQAGFQHVYLPRGLPHHEDFLERLDSRKRRSVLIATRALLDMPPFDRQNEPAGANPWKRPFGFALARLARFLLKPWHAKMATFRARVKPIWNRLLPGVALPMRLSNGSWWLACNDSCSDAIFTETFEPSETRFVTRFLRPGMTVLDVGAHHGYYTLLASTAVGSTGRVISFEPSPRERARLLSHIRLNSCRNVTVESIALARSTGATDLFVVLGRDTGCNSLRPPVVADRVGTIVVNTMALDEYLHTGGLDEVDFIKLDVEGAEFDVLVGATQLLTKRPRPVMMVELQDLRTRAWNYPASQIVDYLERLDYRWFLFRPNGKLMAAPQSETYDSNALGVPQERLAEISDLVDQSPSERTYEAQ